jgi:type III restriction enzyme
VQLPDQKGTLIDKKNDVLTILKKEGITEENGKLAIWLSEEKTDTLANVTKNDNEVEVLVFKQAIALGWDCPRASILVIFRESTSFVFTIQTIGRIMRMPELKYYSKDELNKGFVFTNLAKIDITEDYAKDYITTGEAKRDNALYKEIKIPSIYLKRQRERTRLSGEFARIFSQIADQINLKTKITISPSRIANTIIADGKIVNIDQTGEIEHKGSIEVQLSEAELQKRFDKFITETCSPYAPADSSDRLKTALYQFLTKEFQLKKFDSQAQRVVLGKENWQFFVDAINLSKEKYKRDVIEPLSEVREQVPNPTWEVPVVISYSERFTKESKPKSIMKPFYTKKQSEPERLFIEALEKSRRVKWWFKNGESEIKYFAVLRSDGNGAFYPDFIVQFDDGSIGIFDSKSGRTAETSDAGPRAEGLQAYISQKYVYDENDLSSWKLLPL